MVSIWVEIEIGRGFDDWNLLLKKEKEKIHIFSRKEGRKRKEIRYEKIDEFLYIGTSIN